jgi:hypothetical protein
VVKFSLRPPGLDKLMDTGPGRAFSKVADSVNDVAERVEHPIIASRWQSLTMAGTATVTAIANLSGDESALGSGTFNWPETALLRLDVTREDGHRFETAVVQELANGVVRDVEPGLQVAVRCHPDEPKAAVDWDATAHLMQRRLQWRQSPFRWPPPEDWPAPGTVEVRWRSADQRSLDRRRERWTSVEGSLVSLENGKPEFLNGRRSFVVTFTVPLPDGSVRHCTRTEGVPELVPARLVEDVLHPDGDRLVRQPRVGAPLVVLVDPAKPQDAVVDWEATLHHPAHQGLPPLGQPSDRT